MIQFNDLHKVNKRFENEFKGQLQNIIDSGWFILGENVEIFEVDFAAYCGTKYCIGVGNGFDALKLIFKAFIELEKLKIGDEIIVPANTYIASILAITECKLTPILVEPNIETFNIDETLIEENISHKTKGVLAVHLYGQLANMTALKK